MLSKSKPMNYFLIDSQKFSSAKISLFVNSNDFVLNSQLCCLKYSMQVIIYFLLNIFDPKKNVEKNYVRHQGSSYYSCGSKHQTPLKKTIIKHLV